MRIKIDLSRCPRISNALIFRSRQADLVGSISTRQGLEGVDKHIITLIVDALSLYEGAKEIIDGRVGYTQEEVSEIMYLRNLIKGDS